MENSDEQKSAAIMNVGRKGIFDAFRARSRVVVEKEAAAASAMFLKNSASTSMARGFINSLQPCVLAFTKPLPIKRFAPYAHCGRHGFASYISLGEIEKSECYTRVVIHSPNPKVIHRYIDCELEFYDNENGSTTGEEVFHHLKALRDGYLVCTQEQCTLCNKNINGEGVYMQGDKRFCSNECRSDDRILNFEQYQEVKDPYPYIRRSRARARKGRVQFYVGDCRLAYLYY
ncbi:unnamed protein product [Withania somnifera]